MEVHHHTHHPKKWKEYISEFLMLFLAVFAGFMAESYLEYRTDRHKEHDYLVSMISDLKIDSADISVKEKNMKEVGIYGDKLSDIIYNINTIENNADSLYLFSENIFDTEVILQYADGTIDQLKNAGGYRLIKNEKIVEKIKSYIKNQNRIKEQQIGVNVTYQDLTRERNGLMYARMFEYDGSALEGKFKITLLKDKLNQIKSKSGSSFLSKNPTEFIKFSNTAFMYAGQIFIYRAMAIDQKEKATELIKLIQEEINH
mgnify:CR=1 FL=1